MSVKRLDDDVSSSVQRARPDLAGLRGLAVTAVVLAATFPALGPFTPGADVLLVLVGHLVGAVLVHQVVRRRRVEVALLWRLWAWRTLPAGAAVLTMAALVSASVVANQWRPTAAADVVAAAAQSANWRLVDRDPASLAASPAQHFWLISVGAQAVVVVALVVVLTTKAAGTRWRPMVVVALAAAAAVSVVAAMLPSLSSYGLASRFWEVSVGALLALGAGRVAAWSAVSRRSAAWAGIVALAASPAIAALSVPAGPRAAAVLAVLGTAGIIVGGAAVHDDVRRSAPVRLLGSGPLPTLGTVALGWYLWHWPFVVIGRATVEQPDALVDLTALAVSLLVAVLGHRVVVTVQARPSRSTTFPTLVPVSAMLTAVAVVVGLGLTTGGTAGASGSAAAALETGPVGAGALAAGAEKTITPLPADADLDRPPFYESNSLCNARAAKSRAVTCLWGDVTSVRTVVIVGDSKIAQWQTPLATIAQAEGWKLVQITKSGCPFADTMRVLEGADEPWQDCRNWGRSALASIKALDPDLVLTSQRASSGVPDAWPNSSGESEDLMIDGLMSYWRQLEEAGIPVAVVLDNPAPPIRSVPACVERHPRDLTRCAFNRDAGIVRSAAAVQLRAASRVPEVDVVDLTDTMCPDGDRCAAVIGNVLVYRQNSHLTRTYVDSSRPQLAAALRSVTDGKLGTSN